MKSLLMFMKTRIGTVEHTLFHNILIVHMLFVQLNKSLIFIENFLIAYN